VPARALIIAIQKYPNTLPPLEQELPGTVESATKFRDWFRTAHSITPAEELQRLIVCSDDGMAGATHGGSAQAIRQALKALAVAGAAQTEELFVFFSGHGFLFKEGEGPRPADVLVASDFTSMDVGGASCLRLTDIQTELRKSMGAGNHYYFVDACRNEIADDQIDVGSLGVRLPRVNQKEALLYTLFSTTRLSTAPAASPFTDIVIDGLLGKGKSKRPAGGLPPRMRVVWASLEEYVKARLPAADGLHEGTGPAILWEDDLRPNTCTITIANAAAADTFDVTPRDGVGRSLAAFKIQGSQGTWKEAPDDYYLAVVHPKNPVVPIDPPPVDLYENATARFEMTLPSAALEAGIRGMPVPGAPVPTTVPTTTLSIIGPDRSTVVIHDAATGERTETPQPFSGPVKPGSPCVVELFDHERTLIARREVTLNAGEQRTIDLRFPDSPLRNAIAAAVPSSQQHGWVDFSESLGGPVTDPDLGVWLSIIAASRVLGYNEFQKLGPLPLQTFDNLTPGSSALYVLAGFDNVDEPFAVGVGRSAADHAWHPAQPVPGFPGLFEFAGQPQNGGLLVSFASGDRAPTTIASYALPNRATVITVTRRDTGFGINQLLLPVRSLQANLDPLVRNRLPDNPLRAVKFVAQAQRLLARRRSIVESTGPSLELDSALFGKWLDPMMAIVACYELVRQGRVLEIQTPLGNLEQYFGELPDTVALRHLVSPGVTLQPPRWPPLVVDGFTAFDAAAFEVLPQSRLAPSELWTTWRNAVERARVGVVVAEARG
jgi:hypothetical protein